MMNKNSPSPRRGWTYPFTRRWYLVAAVWTVAALAAISWFLFLPTAESLEQRWKEKNGFDPLVAYPKREANEAARRIEELAAPLGIEIAPQGAANRARASKQQRARLMEVRRELSEFLLAPRQVEPVLTSPPPGLDAYLTESEAALREVSRQLREGEAPLWDQDVNEGIERTFPNFLGHRRLHRLLVAMTAVAATRGDREQSLEWLEASWRLSHSLAADPSFIPQLIFLAEMRTNLAVLRAIDFPLEDWGQRVDIGPWSEGMELAFRLETWSFVHGLRLGQFEETSKGGLISDLLTRWRARHGMKGLMEFTDRVLERAKSEDLLEVDYDRLFEEEEARIPRWNVVARMLVPNFFDALARPARLELSTELTRRVIEMRDLLRTGNSEAIAALEGSHPSVREGISWVYQLEGDKVTLRADRPVPDLAESPLPVEVSISKPSSR